MGLEYSLIFGGVQMIASIVPFLVLLVGFVPNLIIVLLEVGVAWPYLIGIIFMYGVIEALEGFVLTPWVMKQETGLHPLTVILTLLVGGRLFGLFGLIMAIPICTTLKILSEEFLLPAWREVAQCDAPPLPPPEKKEKRKSKKSKKKKFKTKVLKNSKRKVK